MMNSAPVPEGELVSKILLKMEGKMNRLQFTLNSESRLLLQADWEGSSCDLSLHNPTGEPVTAGEITVYSGRMMFQSDTPCYGEGYSKLAQYKGTVGDFTMFGKHGDHEHYRLPVKEGWNQCYNMLLFTPAVGEALLLGFASCHRFGGIFRFNKEQLHILLNCEDIVLQPGETIALEQFFMESGDKNKVLEAFGEAICRNHPMLEIKEIPTGWCSWLVYGPNITEQNICANMMAIKERGLALKYIQIDDGYQPHMGDWLSVTDKFNGGIRKICAVIKKAGFEPAIWVAPFIAEEGSKLFGEHPVCNGWGRKAACFRQGVLRRLEMRSLVYAGRNSSWGKGISDSCFQSDEGRMGNPLFQAGCEYVGSAPLWSSPREKQNLHRGIPYGHGGDSGGRWKRQLSFGMQCAHVAVPGSGSRNESYQ